MRRFSSGSGGGEPYRPGQEGHGRHGGSCQDCKALGGDRVQERGEVGQDRGLQGSLSGVPPPLRGRTKLHQIFRRQVSRGSEATRAGSCAHLWINTANPAVASVSTCHPPQECTFPVTLCVTESQAAGPSLLAEVARSLTHTQSPQKVSKLYFSQAEVAVKVYSERGEMHVYRKRDRREGNSRVCFCWLQDAFYEIFHKLREPQLARLHSSSRLSFLGCAPMWWRCLQSSLLYWALVTAARLFLHYGSGGIFASHLLFKLVPLFSCNFVADECEQDFWV